MLKFYSYDVVFQEVPNEVSLAINISGCENRCVGCHSPWLWEDVGDLFDKLSLEILLERYGSSVTCVCFMGGDKHYKEVARLAEVVKQKNDKLKVAWYSGRECLSDDFPLENFDFIKLGRYIEHMGGLTSDMTNQRFYSVEEGRIIDKTNLFRSEKQI